MSDINWFLMGFIAGCITAIVAKAWRRSRKHD